MKIAFFLLSMIATALATLGVVTWSQLRSEVVTLESHVAALEARVEAAEKLAGDAQGLREAHLGYSQGLENMLEILGELQAEQRARGGLINDFKFYNERDRREWIIGTFDRAAGTMTNVLVASAQPAGRLLYLKADGAIWEGNQWRFRNAFQSVFDPANKDEVEQTPVVAELVMPDFVETPDEIWSEFNISQLSARDATKRALRRLNRPEPAGQSGAW